MKVFLIITFSLLAVASYGQQMQIIKIIESFDSISVIIIAKQDQARRGTIDAIQKNKWRDKWSNKVRLLDNLTHQDDTILFQYLSHAKLYKEVLDSPWTNQLESYGKLLSIKSIMDHYKTAYLINKLLERVEAKADSTIVMLGKTPDTIRYFTNKARDSINSYSRIEIRDTLIDSLKNKSDSIVSQIKNLSDYGPWYVGPSLYVENTYGFNLLIIIDSLNDNKLSQFIGKNLRLPPNRFSIMPEILFYSNSTDRELGVTFYFGYSVNSKVIVQLGPQLLQEKRELETMDPNNFSLSGSLLFKNREWIAGFSYSSISGGGIKLLIGL